MSKGKFNTLPSPPASLSLRLLSLEFLYLLSPYQHIGTLKNQHSDI